MPFMKFYVRDWQADTALRSCSLQARGCWIEMLCVMAQADNSGYLTGKDGEPIEGDVLARLTGCVLPELELCLAELEANGVLEIDPANSAIFCRRMVRDQVRRDTGSKYGKKGKGNPALRTGKPPAKPDAPKKKHTDYRMDDFTTFWQAWPRKKAKADAERAWRNHVVDIPEIGALVEIVDAQKASDQWQKEEGQYIPHPATWLNAERWTDEAGGDSTGRNEDAERAEALRQHRAIMQLDRAAEATE